jgi:hypothetical protein
MENPFKGVVLGSDAAKGFGSRGGGGKRIKEETREEQIQAEWTEDSRVIAQVELLSNLSAEMNLNMSAKPGKHDSTMYRFARLRGNKVMRPENFYSGYWRVKIVDPNNSNRTLRLGVCDLKGEGAYIMFDKNTPDDAFEGSGSKSRLQHQHGGVLVPFSGAANWQAEMQHILKKFFDNGSRYYSLGHLDGRPELYNSNKPEMRTTLRKDLINVANQLYGTIGPMQKTNPRQRAQHETSLVQQLTVEDFKNRIPENFDFGFRGVGGGKSGESILENFAVYLGLTTKVHRNAESAVINGARTESERVEDAKYNSILQEALDELKRLAFGIQKPKNPHYKQHVVEDETEVDIIDKYLAEVGINKGINDARLKVGAKPLSKAELARIRVENYNGAASGFIDLEHGQQILDEENKKD